MAERLFGIETECALTGLDVGGKPVDRDAVLAQLGRSVSAVSGAGHR